MPIPRLRGVEFHIPHRGYRSGPHASPWHELVLIQHGTYRARGPAGLVELKPGEWQLWPAGVSRHPMLGTVTRGALELYYLAWTTTPQQAMAPRRGDDPAGRLRCALHWLRDAWNRTPRPEALLQNLLEAVLDELEWHQSGMPVTEDKLERGRRFLIEHIASDLEMADVAQVAGLGTRQFQRNFLKRFGMPPKTYLLRQREQLAVQLLTQTSQDLATIAKAVHMPGSAYLCRRIRQVTGKTPGQIRRST